MAVIVFAPAAKAIPPAERLQMQKVLQGQRSSQRPLPRRPIDPAWPVWIPLNTIRSLVFCSAAEKESALRAMEVQERDADVNETRLRVYLRDKAAFVASLGPADTNARIAGAVKIEEARQSLEVAAKLVTETHDLLVRARLRRVADCSTAKGALPPSPVFETAPWTPWPTERGFCDLDEKTRRLAAVRAALAVEERNLNAASQYADELFALKSEAANPTSRWARYADAIKKAAEEASRTLRLIAASKSDLETELARASRTPVSGCPPPGADQPKTIATPAEHQGHGALPWTPRRPSFPDVETPAIPAFCDEFARNKFLQDAMLPAMRKANANVEASNAYLAHLNEEYAAAAKSGAPSADLIAIMLEIKAFGLIAKDYHAKAAQLAAVDRQAREQPLECIGAPSPANPTPVDDAQKPAQGVQKVGCNCLDRTPINVGPNGSVGSGARAREKVVSTAVGLLGGLLPGGSPLGGGGGSDGPPQLVCRIGDKDMTIFTDPATGVSLKIAARRVGDRVVVFTGVGKSPDAGTFQTAYLQDADGARQAPRDVGICDLWGEWKLTVSWTKTSYVDNQVVKRESGGWSKSGDFRVPGTLSSGASPDGLWKRLGFSNASHGARRIAATFEAPRSLLAHGPLGVVIHVTRPGQDPVTTVPFALLMREESMGFTFEQAPDCGCAPDPDVVRDVDPSRQPAISKRSSH